MRGSDVIIKVTKIRLLAADVFVESVFEHVLSVINQLIVGVE